MFEEDQEWLDYKARFAEVYDQSNYTRGLQGAVMRASHRLTEAPWDEHAEFGTVLEIGAGTGAHLPFVRHRFARYVMTDLDPKALDAARRTLPESRRPGVAFEVQAGERLSYPAQQFDRLIATHVLEHVPQPHLVLKEWRRVLKPGGVLSVLIPTDPGLAWRLGRTLGPRRTTRALGFAYDYIMAREHVNSCTNLVALLRHYFPAGRESWWPLKVPSVDLNLFVAFHATIGKQG